MTPPINAGQTRSRRRLLRVAAGGATQRAEGLAHLAFEDPEFDGQFLRALDTIYFEGADVGECFSTARRIPNGAQDAWHDEWIRTGERIYGYGIAARIAARVPIEEVNR